MGGFEQTASAEVYKRWCAFGLLSSHSRLHGSGSYRVPWLFDNDEPVGGASAGAAASATDVLRHFTKLKCRLMPYLFAAAGEAHAAGIPVMRAMPLEFPDDPGCDALDRQYMLGESLLVAPVFTPDGTVDYYLPAGRWTHFLTGQIVEGGRWVRERHDTLSLPLLARPNSIIAVGAIDDRPDYDFADGVTFHVFELQDGATLVARVPTLKGETAMTVEVSRWGKAIRIEARGATQPWRVLLRGVPAVRTVEGGTAQEDALGTLLIPVAGAIPLTARL